MKPQQLSERLWHFAARIAKGVDALPETLEPGLSITDDKFSMTNSQLKGPTS
jgi:hypothetical protein